MSKIEKHAPGTICWVDLMTTDAEKAREFYKALFDWTFAISGPEAGHYALAQKDGDQVAGLGPKPPGAAFPPAWSVYFASDDVDATAAKVTEAGGKIVMPPMDVMEEGRMAVFADTAGAVFGVWQAKRHGGAKRINEPAAMCWHEVYAPDAKQAVDFYARVFALEPHKMEMKDGPPTEYYTLHKGPTTVGGVMQMTKEWAGVPPHWMAYFAVQDTDASVKRITELGGKVAVPPFDTPYGRIAVVNDPTGAVFSIIKMAQSPA